MPFSLSLKSLIRLQKRQFLAGKTKRDLAGPIFLFAYIWGVAILIYVLAKDEIPDIPSLALVAICAGLLIFEFVFKLIFIRDETVMDAFLKTQSDRVQATYYTSSRAVCWTSTGETRWSFERLARGL